MKIVLRWRPTEPVLLGARCESWQLVDMDETEHAFVFNTHRPDTDGNSFYWAVKPFHETDNIGSARTAADARTMAEKRLAIYGPD